MTFHRFLTQLTALTLLVVAVAGQAVLSPRGVQGAADLDAAAATSGIFVGRVEDSNALIGIVTNGNGVVAYICDNVEADWFRGQVVDGHAALTATGGAQLTIDFSTATPSGLVHLQDGLTLSFATETAEGVAGLYRAEATINGMPLVGGWIVLGEGNGRGIDTHPLPHIREDLATRVSDGATGAEQAGAGLKSLDLTTLTAMLPGGVPAPAQRLTPAQLVIEPDTD
jgi:hypothetical protein